jgi:CHASE3 domain sensor protein
MPLTPRKFRDFLDRASLREVGVPTLLAAVVLFVAAMSMLGNNVSALRESYGWVQRSNNVLLDIAEINTLVMGVDMTVRGYALTDKPDFLLYEADNRHRLGIAIDNLASLASDDPGQSVSIVKLRALVARQEEVFVQLSSLGPGHAKDVAAAIIDPATREKRYAVQRALTALHDDEIKRLAARQREADRQVSHAFNLALGIVVFASIAGALGIALMLYGRGRAE